MKTVRIGVFETNSSSCHSISIDKNYFDKNTYDIYNYIKDGALIIELGEFGWGYDESNSSYVKASYILTMCHETNDMANMSNILDLIGTAVQHFLVLCTCQHIPSFLSYALQVQILQCHVHK